MSLISRIARHARITGKALYHRKRQTPPLMIVFINSICNLTCEHCFYWRNLNRRDDLTFEEFRKLSLELGNFETLNLSGGEPFIRSEFAEICSLFIENNGVTQIYVPTNGYFTERTERQLRELLKSRTLHRFVCELSLDGMPEYHNRFRGNPKSFAKAMETYQMLAALQKEEPQASDTFPRSEEHTSELQSHSDLVCRLLLEKKKKTRPRKQTTKRERPTDRD